LLRRLKTSKTSLYSSILTKTGIPLFIVIT
jgi:hypothetical protein